MKKSLCLTLIALSAPVLAANNNAVDMAQPTPPSKVITTSVITTERTVGGQTTSESTPPVTQVQEVASTDKLPPPQRFDDSNAQQTRQHLRQNLQALQKADSLEAMAEPLRLATAYAEQAQLLGLGGVNNSAQQDYVDKLAALRQDIVRLQQAVDGGDLAAAKAQIQTLAQSAAVLR